MPRAKVDPLNRRRVPRACDVCRKRKEKCDGNLPCGHCRSRHKDHGCRYSRPFASSNNPSRGLAAESRISLGPPGHALPEGPGVGDTSYTEEDALSGFSASADPAEQTIADSAPIPKQSRMLPDAKGELSQSLCRLSISLTDNNSVYVGQSASLSYLHIVQKVAAECVGPCTFADASQQQYMIEKDIPACLGNYPEPEPELEHSLVLAEQYGLAVSGVFDFFCVSYLHATIPRWVADPNRRSWRDTPVIFLALAIGALVHASEDDDDLAERYFNYGRQQAVVHLMDDPCLSTVIAFSLISYYMLASCRRNGAFTNLGIAARTAYALGIHRHETNRAIGDPGRERAWKSLRVCDLFLSASMGRPPATSEADCSIPWSKAFDTEANNVESRDCSPLPSQEDSAILRICLIFERILVEVFSKRSVSLDLAGSISQQHRQWTEELPAMLKIDGLLRNSSSTMSNIQNLGTHIVTMAYHYSITLLCRPFLSFHVGTRLKSGNPRESNPRSESITTYADACVDSAIQSIALAEEIVFDESMPKRQPIIINGVFISALCLGHASFGDYDQRGWPINCYLDTAISILRKLSPKNPLSVRYTDICCHMKDAIGAYIHRRADMLLRSSNMNVKNVFGDVQAVHASPPHISKGNTATPRDYRSPAGHDRMAETQPRAEPYGGIYTDNTNNPDYTLASQNLTVTPGGLLRLTGLPESDSPHEGLDKRGHYQTQDDISPTTMNNFAFSDTVPLFSLIDELGPSLSADNGVFLDEI